MAALCPKGAASKRLVTGSHREHRVRYRRPYGTEWQELELDVTTVCGRTLHQVGLPYHRGPNGLSTGDAANELGSIALDPNVHIQESKAGSCDIRPGRRPRGPALVEHVRDSQRRAGTDDTTGTAAVTT